VAVPVRVNAGNAVSADGAVNYMSAGSGEAFMGLELVVGSLSGNVGSVKYPKAFGV
jgi:hypothetical protein